MTRDSRIGLLVGLMFILSFGLILTEMINPAPPATNDPAANAESENLGSYRHASSARAEAPVVDRPEPERLAAYTGQRETSVREADGPRPLAVYTVQRGDTLRAIASRHYGENMGDYYVRIVEANRDRMRDGSTIYVGQVLVIPRLSDRRVQADQGRNYTEMTMGEVRDYFGTESTETQQPQSQRRYTIRQGDTLTSIARRMMGDDSASAVRRLYEANRGWIADPDDIPVGAALVIP
jgi:nucleoid-associated protein YgaU